MKNKAKLQQIWMFRNYLMSSHSLFFPMGDYDWDVHALKAEFKLYVRVLTKRPNR